MSVTAVAPRVSVLMPTWNHAHFIGRAVASLLAQDFQAWELVIVDDASPDDTARALQPLLADPRIRYERLPENCGLGAALNAALNTARADLIAYLPSDDLFHRSHLSSLVALLDAHPEVVLTYSGVRHHYNREAPGRIPGESLQLVQVMHRATQARWIERAELVSDDLDRLFWSRLLNGECLGTGTVTCEWADHPDQTTKAIREPVGGINLYRSRFRVAHPLRFHTTVGNRIDEVAAYAHYRERPPATPAPDGLTILLAGELAYNADRVLALEEAGHRLLGTWMPDPYWYNTVGPLPFGQVTDVAANEWTRVARREGVDVVYALLNWQAVPFAHRLMRENPGIPFVWHFKEGPFICLEKGTWRQLVELYAEADGRVYSSPEMRDWFATVVPGMPARPELVLDGDLPKRDWFERPFSPRLAAEDGHFHTVVPGRPIGLHPHTVAELAAQRVHLHFYGDFTHGQWREWIDKAQKMAPGFLHLHAQVDQAHWVEEFSQYDAGWLHFFRSDNGGDLMRANWDDLNYPARLATLAAAGLPVLQRDNPGSLVATQTLARELGIGLLFDDMAGLRRALDDRAGWMQAREAMRRHRDRFTFDHHVPALVSFLREVIGQHRQHQSVSRWQPTAG